jgi:hypothetical protein
LLLTLAAERPSPLTSLLLLVVGVEAHGVVGALALEDIENLLGSL